MGVSAMNDMKPMRAQVGRILGRVLILMVVVFVLFMVVNMTRVWVSVMTRVERRAAQASVVLTADQWAVLTNTGFSWARVEDAVSGRTTASFGDCDPHFRMILQATWAPDLHVVSMTETNVQYRLSYSAGMDPADISVSLKEGRIYFKVGDHWYQGGSAARFLELLSSSTTKE